MGATAEDDEAYRHLSPRQKQHLTFATFQRQLEDFNAKAGNTQERRLRAITWYNDTPQSGPGLYAAVDYSGTSANLALHCGYVVWQEQPDGDFLLIREETNVLDNATQAKLPPGEIERIRAQFRC